RLAAAQQAARENAIDGALLDVNLNGKPVHPVADILAERGIPFAFVTGYAGANGAARFDACPVLRKPFRCDEVQAILARLLAAA
ncbi:MAG TPA: two-component system response regulator protein-glutamate methylesterase, partial [Stellaceae bacterium]|nr:two-component system response regulator protein-glutamate methylesterase [Stellaceae bacterium]